jgi:hypothetical protein
VQAAPVTSWSIVGDTLNIGKINANTVRDDDIAAGRVVYGGTAGLLSDDAGLTYDAATDTLTVGNLTVGGVPYFAESEASFAVWADAGLYYAKDGHTGAVTSGATFNTFLNTLMSTLSTAGGGRIDVKAGYYALTNFIVGKSNVWLRGEGDGTIFDSTTHGRLVFISENNFRLSDLRLVTSKADGDAIIYITATSTVIEPTIIDRVTIDETVNSNAGIRVVSAGAGIYNLQITNCRIDGCPYGIILIANNAATNWITGSLIKNNWIHDFDLAIYLYSAAGATANGVNWNNIGDNQIQHSRATAAVGVQMDGFCYGNALSKNQYWKDGAGAFSAFSINGADCVYNAVDLEHIEGATYANTGVSTKLNILDRTFSNSGTATLLDGQNHVHVTHGLSYIPTAADITITWTEAPTNATVYWYLGGFGGTEFILYANDPGASNLDFSWSARRTP